MAVLKPQKEDSIEIVFGESSSASFSAFVENRTSPQNHDKTAETMSISKEFASAPRDDIFASFPVLGDDSDHSDEDDDIDVFAAIRGGSGGSSSWNNDDNNNNDDRKENGLLVPFPRHEHDADNSNNKEDDDQSTNSSDSSSTRTTNPLQMVRKGAVAVAGGAMVGVGLVMIPLPTPFGAVVAGGGMAVLGTEFEGVQKANERVIDTLIEGIESLDDDNDETTKDNTSCLPQQQQDDDENDGDKRRRRPAALESSKKAASSFLSRNVLPFLRRTRGEYHQPVQEEEEASEHYKDNVGESALSGDTSNSNDNDAEQEPTRRTDRPLSSVRP